MIKVKLFHFHGIQSELLFDTSMNYTFISYHVFTIMFNIKHYIVLDSCDVTQNILDDIIE